MKAAGLPVALLFVGVQNAHIFSSKAIDKYA